ncbi:MAG: hypothetical protein ABSC42_10305 [Tepidisphaeraceae bacterium]|jgi:hypothetical protein
MFKFIRKNKKVVGVVLGVVLMIMFLGNLGPQGAQRNPQIMRTVGTLGNTKITQLQLSNATAEWQFLKSLEYANPNDPTAKPFPLVEAILGPEIAVQIDQAQKGSQSVPMFFLLTEEARRQGIIVNEDDVMSLITSRVAQQTEPGSEEREREVDVITEAEMIRGLRDRYEGVVKITRPYQDFTLARSAQDLSLKVASVRASELLGAIPAPTEADIQKQFDQYSDRVAAVADRYPSEFGHGDDPLGFGYKTPNRVMVQYIGLKGTDVRQAAIASKSTQDWYVAAFGEFKAHRDDYDSLPVPAAPLGPSTNPSADTQPASGVRKLDNLEDDFALHVPRVLENLYEAQSVTLEQNVLKQINEKLSAGYGAYRDALAGGGKADTAPAQQYVAFKFMQDLAVSIRTQFGVTPSLGNIQQPKNEVELADLEGIGKSILTVGNNNALYFSAYAVRAFQPWMTDAAKSSPLGALAIAPWQPSNPLHEYTGIRAGENVYVFRISGTDPSHTPPLADVKDQVIADWKISAAYAKALDAARSLFAAANKNGLDTAAAAAKLSLPIQTDLFDPQLIASGRSAPVISPLILSPDSARELATIAQQLLSTSPAANGRPQLLSQLYADRTVVVLELYQAKPVWDSQTKPLFSQRIIEQLTQAQCASLEMGLFTAQAVADRVGYHAEPKSY